jgi:uncharacterized protein
MKRIITFTIIMLALTACTVFRVNSEPAVTEGTQVNMPNPASVYCEQQGNQLEIRTAADGSQSGICVFPDGSTCDEWAYYRGECGPAAQKSPTPAMTMLRQPQKQVVVRRNAARRLHAGTRRSLTGGASSRVRSPAHSMMTTSSGRILGQFIYFGIDSMDPAVQAQIEALRDSGKIVHLYGTLFSNVPDYNGSQIQVDRIDIEE